MYVNVIGFVSAGGAGDKLSTQELSLQNACDCRRIPKSRRIAASWPLMHSQRSKSPPSVIVSYVKRRQQKGHQPCCMHCDSDLQRSCPPEGIEANKNQHDSKPNKRIIRFQHLQNEKNTAVTRTNDAQSGQNRRSNVLGPQGQVQFQLDCRTFR